MPAIHTLQNNGAQWKDSVDTAHRLAWPVFSKAMLFDLGLPFVDDGTQVRKGAADRPLGVTHPGGDQAMKEIRSH